MEVKKVTTMQIIETLDGDMVAVNSHTMEELMADKAKGVDFTNVFDDKGNEHVIDLSTIE